MSSPPIPISSPSSISPEPVPPSRSTPTNDDIEAVIKMATSSHPSVDRPLRDTRTQLFVGNLPYRVRWQDLKDLFRRAGTVLRADVSLGPDNRSRGYGTVLLATAEDAGRAIDMFNGYSWQTRVLEVRPDRLGATLDADLHTNPSFPNPSVPLLQHGLPLPIMSALNNLDELTMSLPGNGEFLSGGTGMRTLFVGNLPFHIQWQDLKDLFRAAGAVARADVALGPDGRSRGFGTVTFVTEDGAERARRMFDGYEFNGRPLKVHYDKFCQLAQNNPLGVSPQIVPPSLLPSYDSLSQLASPLSRLDVVSAHEGRPLAHLDPVVQSQLHLDLQRSRLETEGLTAAQLDALLARPRSSSFKSPSLTPSTVLSQSPPHIQSPVLLHSQGQSLNGSNPISQSSATSLSQPDSLTGSPNPISTKVLSGSSSSRTFTATDLTLVTDLSDIKLTPDSFTSLGTSFGSPRPSLSAGSSQTSGFSSCGSRRPNLSAMSRADVLSDGVSLSLGSQRTSLSNCTGTSFGATNVDRPSFGVSTSERLVGAGSERLPFGSANPQRLSANMSVLQNPSGTSQRHTTRSFSEDDAPAPPTSTLSNQKLPSTISLGLQSSKTGSLHGPVSKTASSPSLHASSVSNDLSDLSRVGSPESRGSSGHSRTRTSSRTASDEVHPETSLLAKSILNSDSSTMLDTNWGASKPQSRKEQCTSKINGTVDYVSTALGALGMRRANRAQNIKQAEDKKKPSTPPSEQPSQASSAAGNGKKSTQASSHRHPGPISLPPPTAFTLPPGVVFSPHAHPQSPIYHPGYPLSPIHPHPMGSPLHHPMGSPLHHPSMHSPLHHPSHPQYGVYPHHAAPVHYGVITPHGLPPITPSMPSFTFLPPQTQNGQAREDKGSEDRYQHASQSEASRVDTQKWDSSIHASQPYPQSSSGPPQQVQYTTQVHPPLFSPGIPLSPGIIVPLSPGIVSTGMPIAGVPVPMTPGVALTPGVTMTPGAFWSHPPWINPTVGAPVHAANGVSEQPHVGVEGYFPPVSQLSGDTGYFPLVPAVADDSLKEEYRAASGSGLPRGDSARERLGCEGGASENVPQNSSPRRSQVSSPDPSPKSSNDGNRKSGPQMMKRSSSAQCEGGLPKRNGLLHRESDPEVTTTNKGPKES